MSLLDAARALHSRIDASALQSERERTLCKDAINAFAEADLWGFMAPREIGGAELDPVSQMELVAEVCRADGSAGWTLAVGAASIAMPGAYLEDEAVAKIFRTPGVILAGQVVPRGTARPTEGGYVVDGRWSFGSGCRHSAWLLGGCMVERKGEPPEARIAVFPAERAQLYDTWFAAGLKGTGSCDYSTEDLFVPESFTFPLIGPQPKRGGAVFRGPLSMLVAPGHAGIALGIGRRALDEIAKAATAEPKRRDVTMPSSRAAFQQAYAKAEAGLSAARLLVVDALEAMWATLQAGRALSLEERARVRLAVNHATDMAAAAAGMAYRFGSSRALFESSPLQRCFRDINAATQHVFVGDEQYERIGQALLGVAPPGVFL